MRAIKCAKRHLHTTPSQYAYADCLATAVLQVLLCRILSLGPTKLTRSVKRQIPGWGLECYAMFVPLLLSCSLGAQQDAKLKLG